MSLERTIADDRWLPVAQVAVVLAMIEAALWTHGRTQAAWYVAAFLVLIFFVFTPRPKAGELGIGLNGILGATVAIPIALGAAAIILLVAWKVGTLRGLYGAIPVPWHSALYAIWAFEQQFILNAFFYKRFERLWGDSIGTVVFTALLFAFVHIPNPVLVPATFLGGVFFVEVFRRWRNIYPLGVAHAVLGLTLAMAFPDQWIRHMRVGLGYFTFHA